jgi:hypothetical protein
MYRKPLIFSLQRVQRTLDRINAHTGCGPHDDGHYTAEEHLPFIYAVYRRRGEGRTMIIRSAARDVVQFVDGLREGHTARC